jgi:acetyltransferase-like isoleucine patch superfamily enzyme
MAIEVLDDGQGNHLDVPEGFIEANAGRIIFAGDNNLLKVGSGTALRGGQIQVWGGSKVRIGEQCLLGFIDIFANKGAEIEVGESVGFTWTVKLHAHEAASLKVGSGSLIAKDTLITVSDMHSIIDVHTRERLNAARDVVIGERVWLAEAVRVMKGVTIGSGSIVGACSLVTRAIPSNCLAVGIPAAVVREGVTWRHDLI